MKIKLSLPSRLTVALVGGILYAGCGGAPTVDATTEAISATQLPNVPGCESRPLVGTLTVRAVAGVPDLYVVFDDGRPLCADSGQGLELMHVPLGNVGGGDVDSNPMPGVSNSPAPASSNPMPGTDPSSSNPMPGTDPGSSNPMPGRPTYAPQGYTGSTATKG